jgi:hypothetical protein
MCNPMAIMAVASVVSTGSAIRQGEQQREWNNYQAEQTAADGNAERSAAVVEAERIRKLARKQAAETTAALSASGVSVGEGTALNINQELYADAEQDAITTIFSGKDRYARSISDASAYRTIGKQQASAAKINAGTTLLSAASNYGKGWKTAGSTTGAA